MPSGEVLGNTSRVPVVSQPPGLQVQAGGWVKERGMGASLLGLRVVAASAVEVGHSISLGCCVTTSSASRPSAEQLIISACSLKKDEATDVIRVELPSHEYYEHCRDNATHLGGSDTKCYKYRPVNHHPQHCQNGKKCNKHQCLMRLEGFLSSAVA